jgi:hypothetical protein
MAELSQFDARIFWGGLYLSPLVWLLLLIVGLLRLQFEYLPVIIAALVLSFANIVGYMKCSSNAQQKMQALMLGNGLQRSSNSSSALAAFENNSFRNWVFNSLLSAAANNVSSSVNENNNSSNSNLASSSGNISVGNNNNMNNVV